MKSLRFALAAATLSLTLPAIGAAQVSDEGVLQVRSGDRDVGSEHFTVTTADGLRITTRTTFDSRPPVELTASLNRQEGAGLAFQLDRRGGQAGAQIYAVQKHNRITIRRIERGAEQASEVPAGPRTVLLADSVFALYLQIIPYATETGQSVSILFPHGARRATISAQRVPHGAEGTIISLTGDLDAEILLGNDDKVQRISLPALRLVAARRVE